LLLFFQANSVYGKTLQNVRDYCAVKLHVNVRSALKAISHPTFKSFSIIDENLVQTNHFLPIIKHNIPIAIGVSILDISKKIMFDAWYNKISNAPNCKIELGMTDTDSFLFKVSNAKSFWQHVNHILDYSNYKPNNPLFDTSCKAMFGYFKDELMGQFKAMEFVGLRAKCYSMLLQEHDSLKLSEKKTCKGINRVTIAKNIKFQDYKSCLFQKKTFKRTAIMIRSTKHTIKTIKLRKKALNFLDTKRYIFSCGIHSEPYGSVLIRKHRDSCPICIKNY
jgi:hypothetical protein